MELLGAARSARPWSGGSELRWDEGHASVLRTGRRGFGPEPAVEHVLGHGAQYADFACAEPVLRDHHQPTGDRVQHADDSTEPAPPAVCRLLQRRRLPRVAEHWQLDVPRAAAK